MSKVGNLLSGALGPRIFMIFFLVFLALIVLSRCLENIPPGFEGHIFKPYTSGLDTETHYDEGIHIIAPWNQMITYDIRQQTISEAANVLDKNGLPVSINLSVTFSPSKGKTGYIHKETGSGYEAVLISPQIGSVTREVIGRYTAEELYSSKRDVLQTEIHELLQKNLLDKNITIHYALVSDVDLPDLISQAIQSKEEQEQSNLLAEKKKVEAINIAAAQIEEARGDSTSRVIRAAAEAMEIKLKQEQLARSPNYIELVKAQQWDGSYGEGNVYGEGISLFKGMK